MGVLPCSRSGCEHIMCTYMISRSTWGAHVYICEDCLQELRALAARTLPEAVSADDALALVDRFLDGSADAEPKVSQERFDDLVGLETW
jgi:hypothetical protein